MTGMTQNKTKKTKKEVDENIIEALTYFSTREKTSNDWLNERRRNPTNEDSKFFDLLFSEGFLIINGLNYKFLSEGVNKHTSLFSAENRNKIIFVTELAQEPNSIINSNPINTFLILIFSMLDFEILILLIQIQPLDNS